MSNSSGSEYKGKSIIVDEEPNDEWENPSCDDNQIGYPLPPKLDASNHDHARKCRCCVKTIKIENDVKDLQEELRELHLAYKNNFMMLTNIVKDLAKKDLNPEAVKADIMREVPWYISQDVFFTLQLFEIVIMVRKRRTELPSAGESSEPQGAAGAQRPLAQQELSSYFRCNEVLDEKLKRKKSTIINTTVFPWFFVNNTAIQNEKENVSDKVKARLFSYGCVVAWWKVGPCRQKFLDIPATWNGVLEDMSDGFEGNEEYHVNDRDLTTKNMFDGLLFIPGYRQINLSRVSMVHLRLWVRIMRRKKKTLVLLFEFFRRGLPEWTVDLTNYLPKHFPQQECAIGCDLLGYLALPVIDLTTSSCVGVIELLTSSKYVNYAHEILAFLLTLKLFILQTQNLRFPQAFDGPAYVPRQNELDKIIGILKTVCDIYNLPLAQTWVVSPSTSFVSHDKIIKKCCCSFDTKCIGKVCMSTTYLPFYLKDLPKCQFRKTCAERKLEQSSYGAVGRALLCRSLCFCRDVTILNAKEYSLVYCARMFKLASCFAIYLHSVENGDDYILEFFFPSECGRW
ncbi:PB1 domain-containing protein [Artemisia annua]|uniref:PB1 domain-containing protein n=1 Tax=Artemisia annua TaxID=35608 RepID=A0A2U1LXF7_ARTAN|nr:PB1 domain-containing protein [Artemisia annua]